MNAHASESSPAGLAIPDLAAKAVLVTGASTGIGAAVARAFAHQGAHVALHYNSSAAAASEVANDIVADGGTVHLVGGDFSRAEDVARVIEDAATHFGRLDGLVNNAGLMLGRVSLQDMDDAQYDAVMDLNARSVLTAIRCAHPWLRREGGFVINTTSVAARTGGTAGATLYASAKAFVSSLTRGLAKELIADGIRVNAVSPGVVQTAFHVRYSNADQMSAMLRSIPATRFGTPEDCVGAYLFLASSALSGYIVGQTIEVNGGQFMP